MRATLVTLAARELPHFPPALPQVSNPLALRQQALQRHQQARNRTRPLHSSRVRRRQPPPQHNPRLPHPRAQTSQMRPQTRRPRPNLPRLLHQIRRQWRERDSRDRPRLPALRERQTTDTPIHPWVLRHSRVLVLRIHKCSHLIRALAPPPCHNLHRLQRPNREFQVLPIHRSRERLLSAR